MENYVTSIFIEAEPDAVFDYLINPEYLVTWMGDRAVLKPEIDGVFAVDINGVLIRGHYLEIQRPHRLCVSWGQLGNEILPPGSSRVTFTLTKVDQGTRLELTHDRLPEIEQKKHAVGWPHFLERLRIAGGGGNPGPDPWLTSSAATTKEALPSS